ncbi:methylenetetrahydrofolate reductase [Oceanobacter sp. 3_MG-2023]|uniref:methylenetetrahydrofolate reductase n=1 Tax=Oceanobacter sp. 3_MG-2023 TaxID=3062622 RepID=UPI002733BA72|nr:methylenetetrahydrofolate reductase [Oceanobacter sp. 3_MG-2023]MDP2504361.1 methylenetetrahydrofolate reductase [Oceanobacter sp. 3_MG-2023]
MLTEKIRNRESGIVLYGIVPPKKGTEPARIAEIAELQIQRMQSLPIDGLVLYDIQDEESRTAEKRPFPFIETLDCFDYSRQQLAALTVPKIIYRAAGKYPGEQLSAFLQQVSATDNLTVFVGAASKDQSVTMTMSEAYQLKQRVRPDVLLGGVMIPERHRAKGDEHLRVFEKIRQGCSFFISQGVYDLQASKDFLSDYYYAGKAQGIDLVPVIFTLTPCGSVQTLNFMKWLGISIPRWLENELLHAHDILEQSVNYSEANWRELKAFADTLGVPVGCNIESVAVRKVEVEAAIELLNRVSRPAPSVS